MALMDKRSSLKKEKESGETARCLIIGANSTHLTLCQPNNTVDIKAGWKGRVSAISQMVSNEFSSGSGS